MNLPEFQAKWSGVTLTERSASQSHFNDLCALFGVPTPVAADPTGERFTVPAHEIWSLRLGTWLGVGNDPRYTPTTCFETFPLPLAPGREPWRDPRLHAVADAARALDEHRRAWLDVVADDPAEQKKRTLTNLYNPRPTWLANLHAALDHAVWAAYGWDDDDPATVAEDAILGRLLALNLARAG